MYIFMTALICQDADYGEVESYWEKDDQYSKSSFISSWVEQVVRESKLYFSTMKKTNLYER